MISPTITTTGSSFPFPGASSGTSHSAEMTTQQLESSDRTQVSITSNESTTTTVGPTTTPDSSSSIFTSSSEPNHLTIRSTTETYSTVQVTTQPMNTSVSPINYQSTATQTTETLTNRISTSRSAKTTSMDTSATHGTPKLTLSHANNDFVTTTLSNAQGDSNQKLRQQYIQFLDHWNINWYPKTRANN